MTSVSSDEETAAEPESETQTVGETLAEHSRKYIDGTYSGTGNGYEGPITLSVTVEDDRITWIEVTDSIEDPEFFTPALDIIGDVINAQHTNLDAVSGSTYSSYGLLDAIDDALSKAKSDSN